jgi:hypothetical protein
VELTQLRKKPGALSPGESGKYFISHNFRAIRMLMTIGIEFFSDGALLSARGGDILQNLGNRPCSGMLQRDGLVHPLQD